MNLFFDLPPSKLKLKKAYFHDFQNLWEQASLPLGNGTLGISVLGDVKKDTIYLNNKNLWRGGPAPKRPNYVGGNTVTPDKSGKLPRDYYKEIYDAFKNGDDRKAHILCEKLTGSDNTDEYGAYLCRGVVKLAFPNILSFSDYKRKLDLENGLCEITYSAKLWNGKKVKDTRKFFSSYPDSCTVMSFTREGAPISLEFTICENKYLNEEISYKDSFLTVKSSVKDNDLRCVTSTKVLTDGSVSFANRKCKVSNATYVNFITAEETDYIDQYPTYRVKDFGVEDTAKKLQIRVNELSGKGVKELETVHKTDFSRIMNRVSFNLGGADNVSADTLIRDYGETSQNDRKAEELLYQFGRYLLISSSRETDILPANLQGIWNCTNKPKWSSDYHLNINLQMNYWHVFSGNIAECANPLIRYIKSLVEPGRVTAEYYTNVKSSENEKNGFLFHTQNTPFGWTCPGWVFDWGWSPAAVPWILHNCYEHFEYTGDKEILKNDVYPMLKETAEYFSRLLVENGDRLVTYPCFSPEHGPRTMGNTYEQALISQLYEDAITSAKALSVDADLIEKWQSIKSQLKPYEIGDDGQIKEWYHETTLGSIGEHHHRHMSHLLGLFPCNVMNKEKDPDLIDAAIISMNHRGDKSTGWSMGQKINSWARVGDGNRAHKLITDLFKNGIYLNFYDFHPPFQIDGNFGFTAGVNEMLMQSHCGFVELLPALPSEWKKGSIKGLVARGNFTINIEWNDEKITRAEITSNMGGTCKIYYGKSEYIVENICESENGFVEFQTEKGKIYTIKTI